MVAIRSSHDVTYSEATSRYSAKIPAFVNSNVPKRVLSYNLNVPKKFLTCLKIKSRGDGEVRVGSHPPIEKRVV